MGAGTFGQVAKCKNMTNGELVGVKIIKNKPAYTKQSLVEVNILKHVSYFVKLRRKRNTNKKVSS